MSGLGRTNNEGVDGGRGRAERMCASDNLAMTLSDTPRLNAKGIRR